MELFIVALGQPISTENTTWVVVQLQLLLQVELIDAERTDISAELAAANTIDGLW